MELTVVFKRLLWFFVLISFSSAVYGQTLNCERYSTKGDRMFVDNEARDSWMPPILMLPISEFVEKSGQKSMHWNFTTNAVNSARDTTMRFRLLTNGKAVMSYTDITGAVARYKCDKKADEVRRLLASSGSSSANSANSSSNNEKSCFDGNVTVCTQEQLCNRATSRRSGVSQWDSMKQFQPFVAEAKSRGLSCGVTDTPAPTTAPSSSTFKLDKAKSTCTELGFTLGTEKHGECVLKMMDN